MWRLFILYYVCYLLTGKPQWLAAEIRYTIQEIPLPKNYQASLAQKVNNRGTVLGLLQGQTTNSFMWNEEGGLIEIAHRADPEKVFRDATHFLKALSDQYQEVYALDLNDKDQVCGAILKGIENPLYIPFIWDEKTGLKEILFEGKQEGIFYSINNHGDVVGSLKANEWQGVSYTNTFFEPRAEELSEEQTYLTCIDDEKNLWGCLIDDAGSCSSYFLFKAGREEPIFLDRMTSSFEGASCIKRNSLGTIVGVIGKGMKSFIYVWTKEGGEAWSLETLPECKECNIEDLNLANQIVGYCQDINHAVHAFVADLEHGTCNLNHLIDPLSGWEQLEVATSINDKGQITGYGKKNGATRSFLLTPI